MKLFKILIPKEKSQTITERESWSVTWYIRTGWGNDTCRYTKVFVVESDTDEFIKQLEESAKFIGCWIKVEKNKN